MTERIASAAEPVVLPARCCFVTARRLADSKDVEMAASLNGFDNPMSRLLTLARLAESFRGTALGVLMEPALLQSRIPRDERPGRKATCHRSDTIDNGAKPDEALGVPDGSTGPGDTFAAHRRVYVLRTPHLHRNRGRSE